MPNVNTPTPTVNTANKKPNTFLGMDFSNFDFGKFGKAYDALNSNSNKGNTSGFSALGSALSGIANAYSVSNGFDFTNKPTDKTTA